MSVLFPDKPDGLRLNALRYIIGGGTHCLLWEGNSLRLVWKWPKFNSDFMWKPEGSGLQVAWYSPRYVWVACFSGKTAKSQRVQDQSFFLPFILTLQLGFYVYSSHGMAYVSHFVLFLCRH